MHFEDTSWQNHLHIRERLKRDEFLLSCPEFWNSGQLVHKVDQVEGKCPHRPRHFASTLLCTCLHALSHQRTGKSFPQDTNHFCPTDDRSIGTVSDSRMKAHYNCPESLRLVTFTRVYIVWWMHVAFRTLQGSLSLCL